MRSIRFIRLIRAIGVIILARVIRVVSGIRIIRVIEKIFYGSLKHARLIFLYLWEALVQLNKEFGFDEEHTENSRVYMFYLRHYSIYMI